MTARSGLVSYGGDSEISDSEDERVSISVSPPVFQATNSLGIPLTKPRLLHSPPSLPKLVVQAAPATALVDYGDDDHNDSKIDNYPLVEEEFYSPSSVNERNKGTMDVDRYDASSNEVGKEFESEISYLNTRDIVIPPEPLVKCSKILQSRIITLLQKKAGSGVDMNSSLQQRKDLRNPSIYEKLVQFCNLDEFGTNYPEDLYNPREWTEDSHYHNLFKEQKKEYVKKEKAKLDRTTVEFVTGTKRPPAPTPTAKVETGKKKRRTKWDISNSSGPESGGPSPAGSHDRPPLLGNAPIGMQPRVLQTGIVGAQARAQASHLSKELSKAK